MTNENTDLIRGHIYVAKNCSKELSTIPLRFYYALTKSKTNPNLHITKDDKANALVIMDKSDYINKTEQQFSNPNFCDKISTGDKRLDTYNGKFHSSTRNIPFFLRGFRVCGFEHINTELNRI